MMKSNQTIFLSPPHLGTEELVLVQSAIQGNWVSSVGQNLDLFEDSFETYLGQEKLALALNSCTSALHLGLLLLGVGKGDEVVVPSFTFVASVNPVLYVGATPIIVDSEKDTWNMCPILLREAIENRLKLGKKPKAIIVVHLYGMPAKMDEIKSISEEFQIPILEDAAEALGSRYKNQLCGTFGQLSAFSFNGNKIITTSAGGMLLCNTEQEYDRAFNLSTQAKEDADYYLHQDVGYNYRMSNICAGIGLGQMTYLEERINKRRLNHSFYKNIVNKIDSVTLHEEPNSDFFSNHWLSVLCLNDQKSVQNLKSAFVKHNIESRHLWRPMHMQPLFSDALCFVNGVSEEYFNRGLCLPSGTNYSSEDYERIENVLVEFLHSL